MQESCEPASEGGWNTVQAAKGGSVFITPGKQGTSAVHGAMCPGLQAADVLTAAGTQLDQTGRMLLLYGIKRSAHTMNSKHKVFCSL